MKPLFSIIIAFHNHEAFARESVESALRQRYPGKEIIAVDDGSRDRTAEILKGYGDAIVFAGLPVNGGAAAARNHGASLASGEYLVFLDGDDALAPEALDVYGSVIHACQPKMIFARCARCTEKIPERMDASPARAVQYVEYPDFFAKDRPWVYNTSSLIVHRSTFLAAGGWSTEIFFQDIQDLLNKLGVAGKTVLILAPETVWYRMHGTNAVRSVSRFLDGIYLLLARAREGVYPGGRRYRLKRAAWFGGLIFYWSKEALRNGLYRDGFKLLALHGWMIVPAVLRRGATRLAGRRAVETIAVETN